MKRKIFICDDDRNIVEMLSMVLQEFTDATIFTEIDSQNALTRLLQERPDVLIVDIAIFLDVVNEAAKTGRSSTS